ncbi:uncharacterized protein LOC118212396 isoform X1 [Anguilla anguilla]|uniref:uncharacterized protein LOC118212396 isoform X1 n=2 Tax=Anguilla anguilla TaxID=7936 RepID=UPI0015B011D7|nr:uncharacterized protein LOC118212396 isoform X1 [Anguilla anguilla]XP_035246121.1 uncharacterized protein LOC118212396 isoform X1 [Anguilla anguilla]XP_035246130.1 uncharacterized protein LOC118212396 isoform X1 [Anguilla anguilla]
MAVSRRGAALWFTRGRSFGGSPVVQGERWKLPQGKYLLKSNHDLFPISPFRTISNISSALAPLSCTCTQTVCQSTVDPLITHRIPKIRQPIKVPFREETVSLCVLLGPGDGGGQRTLLEVPLSQFTGFSELLPSRPAKSSEFPFPLTTVDGRREDDINVRGGERGGKREPTVQEKESFRSFFEKESCPAPFVWGSCFYCFHCPATHSLLWYMDKSMRITRLEPQTSAFSTPTPVSYYAHTVTERGEGMDEREREREEKLALMHEKMRHELPRFFLKSHDYSMYSPDVEFINGLLNIKTRGRLLYQLSLSLWKVLCVLYFADVRLEVLKLSKHSEDGTIRARWRVSGLPFHLLVLRFYRRDKSSLYRSYDAFSTFYLGSDGLVHCHRVDKVMPAQPPVLPRVTSALTGALVALGLQEHRPALNLLPFLFFQDRAGEIVRRGAY